MLVAVAVAASLFLQGCNGMEGISSTIEAATGLGSSEDKVAKSGESQASSKSSATSFRLVKEGIPLSVGSWFGGPRLLVDVEPQSLQGEWFPKQRMVLDSGSSTLAFCNKQFISDAQYQSSEYISCNLYNPGGDFTGYWGPFVKGPVKAGNVTLNQAAYSIMTQEKNMPCTQGLDGIFGIAFRQLDVAYLAADENQMTLGEEKFTCPQQPAGVVPPPLVQHLRMEDNQQIGIFWSGQQGEGQGRLYLGSAAMENEHYSQQYALAAHLGEQGWYDISVESITVGGETLTGLNCDPVNGQTCILDTGTPSIVLPGQAYDLVQEAGSGSLSFQLTGVGDGPVTLNFDLQKLTEMGAISKGSKGDGLILGLPIWAFYYTVFDLQAQQVIFVPNFPAPAEPVVYPTEGPVWQPEPIQPTQPTIPFPGDGVWSPIPGGAGDILGPMGWPIGFKKENATKLANHSKENITKLDAKDPQRRLRGFHI